MVSHCCCPVVEGMGVQGSVQTIVYSAASLCFLSGVKGLETLWVPFAIDSSMCPSVSEMIGGAENVSRALQVQ